MTEPVDRKRLTSIIKEHEGLRLKPYKDTVGVLTIGYGHNLDDLGITQQQAEDILQSDIDRALSYCVLLEYWGDLCPVRKLVVADMIFNMGPRRYAGFIRMDKALREGKYSKAAHEMLDSKWAGQVGQRAEKLSIMMESGEIPAI